MTMKPAPEANYQFVGEKLVAGGQTFVRDDKTIYFRVTQLELTKSLRPGGKRVLRCNGYAVVTYGHMMLAIDPRKRAERIHFVLFEKPDDAAEQPSNAGTGRYDWSVEVGFMEEAHDLGHHSEEMWYVQGYAPAEVMSQLLYDWPRVTELSLTARVGVWVQDRPSTDLMGLPPMYWLGPSKYGTERAEGSILSLDWGL